MTTSGTGDKLLLHGARVVTPETVLENATVVTEDGRIESVKDAGNQHSDVAPGQSVNLHGATLYPGFIDVHIHGAVGVDSMDATVEDLLSVSRFLATQGVAGWLPTLVPAPAEDYERGVAAIEDAMHVQAASPSPVGARVLGVHYEGPFVNTMQCGALRTAHFRTFSGPADVDALRPNNRDAVSLMTLAPEIDGGIELVRHLVAKGWIASLGHTRADVDILDQAFAAGARHMTHFMNAMASFNHRAPGPVGWGLANDGVTCDIIADGIHLDPLVLRMLTKVKGEDRLLLISDAIAAAGKGDGKYEIWGESISVNNRRTSNARGTIAGSVISMLDAVRMMLSLDASEAAVARMAATNPARLLRIDDDCGSIKDGKRADLVALDAKGNVQVTVIGGYLAFQRKFEQQPSS